MAVSLCGWDDLEPCCDPADFDPAIWERATAIAAEVMFSALGGKYGICDVTVRPCRQSCASGLNRFFQPWPLSFAGGPGYGWIPLCPCRGSCSCTVRDSIRLPGPVASIDSVTIDGTVLDPSHYTLRGRRLIRCDGEKWPTCQDLCAADDADGAFAVAYPRGLAIPRVALAGAGELACQIAKSCSGQDCHLPARVQSIARKGVTITVGDPKDWLDGGYIGLPLADLAISRLNGAHQKAPPGVFRADQLYGSRR